MNPILSKGHKNPLKLDDVPTLPLDHRAERMSDIFETYWPQPQEDLKHLVGVTLLKCFWKELVFTGFLAVVKSIALYIGPVLIHGFVDVTDGQGSSAYEGYYLLCILLISKTIEVLSTHHFDFHSGKLGMLIRSSLMTTVFKKGLRLSCSSRQANGVGKIVNHMAVDADQVAEMMSNVHDIWLMPLHIALALVLVYAYMGVSTFAALAAVVAALTYSVMSTHKTNSYMNSVMEVRDARMRATNEMLNNMRAIKFQGWEEHFSKKVQSSRDQECSWLIRFMNTSSVTLAVIFNAPYVISALTLSAAILLGLTLDAGTVFTLITLLGVLEEPIRTFPDALISFSQAIISLERLDLYLTSSDLDGSVEREEECSDNSSVKVQQGNFSWDDNGDEKILIDINLGIQKGELVAIVGTVGSGKSSLLASILGEMHKITGTVLVSGTTGYVAQTPWIQHCTIEENILFGLPMDRERYQEVLRVCCLEKDLEIMEFGDKTEIGERGINLSGGQKQRIQLARAVYQDCDIYFLDDIFSAVDAQTGSEIFKECVRGILKDKTILLVTHQVDFLQYADLIMLMRDGMIVQSGKYENLLKSGMDFGALVAAHENSMMSVNMNNSTTGEYTQQTQQSSENSLVQVKPNGESIHSDPEDGYSEFSSEDDYSKLIEEEEKETGHITWELYTQYCTKAYGWWGVAIMVLVTLMWQSSLTGSDYWLAYETSPGRPFTPLIFISLYWVIIGVSCLCILARAYFVSHLGLAIAQRFFNEMLQSILHAPMSFFDTTPSGRILTRVRYRPNTPLVLKGITLTILGGEKVGIVGRTGSGKSTLIQAFFRLVEPSDGTITIDGIDITKLGLHDLRSRLGIIPQEPVLFEGTVRSNLDPIGLYSDEEIWQSLYRCQLKDVVTAKPEKLDALVANGGDNWSVGQRQLLCLGRLLLKHHCKVIFMDEATASVDSQTDAVIQRIIREDFTACTIISIAHRIPTVMDCNRVLVMDDGI
ncbi:unnamed protein product [Linum tenue]|uniref:ABC-type xenobiotic transporter n=1 Tax=Linum tenue TaxID=586396 RepID=A0AAV0HXK3_9ROSI|nr:unnamed protein product [Linum tenue]